MIKGIGVLLVVLAGAVIGYLSGSRVLQRIRLLREWIRVLYRIHGEIAYGAYNLPELLVIVADQEHGAFSLFLKHCAEELSAYRGKSVASIWEENEKRDLDGAGLSKEDLEKIRIVGSQLGILDQETQTELLKLGIREWEEKLAAEEKEVWEQVRIRRTLGILGGIFLTILLL